MIRTRMGTDVESIVGTNTDKDGQVWVACFLRGMSGMREIHLADLRADNGAPEIDKVLADLPDERRITEAPKAVKS